MENFNDIINSEQLTLVDFFATWCGPCKMMHPVLEQLKAELGDSIRIIKIDVDKNNSLASNYRVQSVPTLMLLDSEGYIKGVWSGVPNQKALEQLVHETMAQ